MKLLQSIATDEHLGNPQKTKKGRTNDSSFFSTTVLDEVPKTVLGMRWRPSAHCCDRHNGVFRTTEGGKELACSRL